jgi:hypothetical protein
LMALTVPLQTGDQPLDGCVAIAGSDLLDEAAQITREIAAEGGAGMVVALATGCGFPTRSGPPVTF